MMPHQQTVPSAGARLRQLLDADPVLMPGAFNGLAARAIARAGFDACYVSGAATSVCAGVPDIGLLTLDHFSRVIREVADASGLPVLADADTGFGEEEMIHRTVIEYHRAGAAGLHVEDQVFPKRCGHLSGKRLIPVEHAVSKVSAAVAAGRACGDSSFIVCARTDAAGVDGLPAAIERAAAYVEAGADMIFPEGLTSEDEFGRFADAMRPHIHSANSADPTPARPHPTRSPYLLANMTEFGRTPTIKADRFAELGYSCVIFPVSLLRVAMGAVTRALEILKSGGSFTPVLDQMQTRDELYDLIGYTPGTKWEFPAHRAPYI